MWLGTWQSTSYKYLFLLILALDVNECLTNENGGCAQNCSNTDGSFECTCGTGYTLADDNLDCIGKYSFTITWNNNNYGPFIKIKLLSLDERLNFLHVHFIIMFLPAILQRIEPDSSKA